MFATTKNIVIGTFSYNLFEGRSLLLRQIKEEDAVAGKHI